ncbi:MLP-like protein 31 [Chenopodium quinoa]|uniref:Bet v I/Major latex protein domain-containing protein n=1 Tax=Chenopodium quinoa TaxID=63459 RepID=A0A803M5Z8_CHEQI|nr:MLP-like protein 31 [Chenopodium quinoa]
MGIKGKLEVEVDINCHGDIFHEIFSTRPHHVSDMSPSNIHACDVHDGEFGKPGSIINWNYTLDGKKCVAKELVEVIDEENKLVRFKIIEGDLLNEFKTFTLTVQVIPMGDITGVKWTAEFDTIDDKGHYPTKLIDFCIAVSRDIEAHHLKDDK